MKFDILPANIKTIKLIKNRSGSNSLIVAVPKDIIERYSLKPGEEIVICYLCKSDENVQLAD